MNECNGKSCRKKVLNHEYVKITRFNVRRMCTHIYTKEGKKKERKTVADACCLRGKKSEKVISGNGNYSFLLLLTWKNRKCILPCCLLLRLSAAAQVK